MATYMTLLKALQSGIIRSDDFIDYNPDKTRHMYVRSFYPGSTTHLSNEFDLGWHPVNYKDFAVLLVSDKVTEASWRIDRTNISFDWLEEYAKMYENKKLNSLGAVPTPELLSIVPAKLKKQNVWTLKKNQPQNYRLRPRYNPAYPHDHKVVRSRCRFGTENAMQPIVFIPPDTIVRIDDPIYNGKTKKTGYNLYQNQALESKRISDEFQKTMWISLTEAVMTRAISTTDFVEYLPNKASVTFSTQKTHAKNLQIAETEFDMGGWHPLIIRKGSMYIPYIVSARPSKFKLEIPVEVRDGRNAFCRRISGENQSENGVELLKQYAQIYNNKELNAQGIPLTEQIFDALDTSLIVEDYSYWLAYTFVYKQELGFTAYYELNTGLKWIAQGYSGYKQSEIALDKQSIRVAVIFPNDIMVEINNPDNDGSSEEKALRLKVK